MESYFQKPPVAFISKLLHDQGPEERLVGGVSGDWNHQSSPISGSLNPRKIMLGNPDLNISGVMRASFSNMDFTAMWPISPGSCRLFSLCWCC